MRGAATKIEIVIHTDIGQCLERKVTFTFTRVVYIHQSIVRFAQMSGKQCEDGAKVPQTLHFLFHTGNYRMRLCCVELSYSNSAPL